MTLSDVEAMNTKDEAEYMLVPLIDMESRNASSSEVIEDSSLLLKLMSKKIRDFSDGVTHQIGFWT